MNIPFSTTLTALSESTGLTKEEARGVVNNLIMKEVIHNVAIVGDTIIGEVDEAIVTEILDDMRQLT